MAKKASTNKKVRNATITIVDGVKFRSKLEAYMYGLLKRHGIKHEYEVEKFPLIPAFKFRNEKVLGAKYTPDFTGSDFIIECKGRPNDAWPIRLKLFKLYCATNNEQRPYYIPRNQKECDAVVAQILKLRASS